MWPDWAIKSQWPGCGGLFPSDGASRHIAVLCLSGVKTNGKSDADLRFSRNQPFAAEPKNREAVIQRR